MEGLKSQIRTFVENWCNEEKEHDAAETTWREKLQSWLSKEAEFFGEGEEGASGEVDVPWRESEEMWVERERQFKEQVEELRTSAKTKLEEESEELPDFAELQRQFEEWKSHLALRKTLRLQQESWYRGRESILTAHNLKPKLDWFQRENGQLSKTVRELQSKVAEQKREHKKLKDFEKISETTHAERQKLEEKQRKLSDENTALKRENDTLRRKYFEQERNFGVRQKQEQMGWLQQKKELENALQKMDEDKRSSEKIEKECVKKMRL
ncbi:hypothetical protein WMY93_031288 [Mugilogobius chulae]|uniref:Uncharacterized protein n=1 Tax=Mugilogobius chulae TaxID=88201 RepID=A0AAW0MGF3_9GOBI